MTATPAAFRAPLQHDITDILVDAENITSSPTSEELPPHNFISSSYSPRFFSNLAKLQPVTTDFDWWRSYAAVQLENCTIAVGGDYGCDVIRIIDPRNDQLVRQINLNGMDIGSRNAMSLLPNGYLVVAGRGEIRFYKPITGELITAKPLYYDIGCLQVVGNTIFMTPDQYRETSYRFLAYTETGEFIYNHNDDNFKFVAPIAAFEKKIILCGLINCNVGLVDNNAELLAGALTQNKSLKIVNLSRNNIGQEGAKNIAEALKYNASITTLELDRNPIGDDGITKLAESLWINKKLRKLNVVSCQIGDIGAKAIAEAFTENKTLRHLEIWKNNIGDEGVVLLAESLVKTEFRLAISQFIKQPIRYCGRESTN